MTNALLESGSSAVVSRVRVRVRVRVRFRVRVKG
jgi:hypothetical protein